MRPDSSSPALDALLAVLEVFTPLPDGCPEAIRGLAIPREYARGDHFARAGQDQPNLGFIQRGVFRAYVQTPDGREYNKTFFTENTFMLTLTAIVGGETNRIDIQALEEATVLLLDYRRFTMLYDRFPPLERMARLMVEREWSKKEQREIALVLDDATSRYARFQQDHPGLENRIAQYHIASYLGISPVHLSRIRARKS